MGRTRNGGAAQHGRIAGPYAPLYPEVVEKLKAVKGYAARWIYVVLLTGFYVEEDWETDPQWIGGIIRATKMEIQDKSGVGGRGSGGFFNAWADLTASGLVKERPDRTICLPMFKKKGYEAISAREVRERLIRLEELHPEALEGAEEPEALDTPGQIKIVPPGGQKDSSQRSKVSSQRSKVSSQRSLKSADILLKGLKTNKTSLSGPKIISWFYKGIGQKKISREKRERGDLIFKKLRKDGFGVEDIAFAVKWTLENANEEPYDFAIMQHTIGQALAARDREEREARALKGREDAEAERQAEREREEQEREEMDAYKQSLSPEESAELRDKALAEIAESGDYKAPFITDILIEVKENEILRKRLVEQHDPGPGSEG